MNLNQQYQNKLLNRYHDSRNQNQHYIQNNKLFQDNPLMANSNYYINEAQRLNELQQINRLERINESNIDKKKLREAIIQPKQINRTKTDKIEFEKALKKAESEYRSKDGKDYGLEIKKYWNERNNAPYKTIIKDKRYINKDFKKKSDLIVHKVTNKDKEGVDDDFKKLDKDIKKHNKELKIIYSTSNETEHKQKFEYNHVFKYRVESKGKDHSDLKKDKMKYYKEMQEKEEEGKKSKDSIINSLMSDGVFNEDELNEYTDFADQIKDANNTDQEIINDTITDDANDTIKDYQSNDIVKNIGHSQKPTKHNISGNKVIIKQKHNNKIGIKPRESTTIPHKEKSFQHNAMEQKQNYNYNSNQTQQGISIKKNPRRINLDDKKVHIVHTTKTELHPAVNKKPVNINLNNKNDQPISGDKYSSRTKKKVIQI